MAFSLAALHRSAVLEDRRRLAGEIHDTLVQDFVGILLHLQAALGDGDAEWSNASKCLSRARELAKRGLDDARRMLLALRPGPLENATLLEALSQLAHRFSREGNITCKFRLIGRECVLPFQVQDELYRAAQEALCNVRKHSRATSASLSLAFGADLTALTIKDNGQGFATRNQQISWKGFGLGTMRERTQRIGGRIEIRIAVPVDNDQPSTFLIRTGTVNLPVDLGSTSLPTEEPALERRTYPSSVAVETSTEKEIA